MGQPESRLRLDFADGVACITLDAPKKLNALGSQLLGELRDALETVRTSTHCRAMILTGVGRCFCSGADLTDEPVHELSAEQRTERFRVLMREQFHPVIEALTNLPVPTLTAVNGMAVGGGVGLALASDLVLAAESASFVILFTPQLGLVPDLGSSWHVPRALGRARAIAAAFLGDPISAAEAAASGLIHRAVPDAELMDRARALARRLSEGPTRAYPEVRRLFDASHANSLEEHLELELAVQSQLAATRDFAEAVEAFRGKRAPRFAGR